MAVLIDQQQNYKALFGATFRSSAIFFKPSGVKTTISFSNYWQFKNSLDVGIVVTTRLIDGSLASRTQVGFEDGSVLNIDVNEIDEGSIEIEAFSNNNLRIPYAAIMAVYETEASISMVHSYGRNHSLIELEDGNSITEGRESCWTLRHDPQVTNSAVFHNGHMPVAEQTAKLIVTDHLGVDHETSFEIPAMRPFETVMFEVERIFPDVKSCLDGKDGWASVHFDNHSSFTRLLILWRHEQSRELQVTHSNFDYSEHQTDMVKTDMPAYMKVPEIPGVEDTNVVVYPKFSPGTYELLQGDNKERQSFAKGFQITPIVDTLAFRNTDGYMPSRLVTAVYGKQESSLLPFECSLGVVHEKRPPKRFHWFVVSQRHESTLHLTSYPEIYQPNETGPVELVFSLYSGSSSEVLRNTLLFDSVESVPATLTLDDIFENAGTFLDDELGYCSMFSHFGGFFVFSSLRKSGSMTLEHSF